MDAALDQLDREHKSLSPEQDRQGRQAPLPHPRHPVPRSRDGGRTAQGPWSVLVCSASARLDARKSFAHMKDV